MGEAFYPVIKGRGPVTAAGIGTTDEQYHAVRRNGYPDHQINLCIQGDGMLIVDGREHHISAGMSFFLPKNVPHEYYALHQPWTLRWVTFAGSGCDALLESLDMTSALTVVHKDISGIEAAYGGIYRHIKKNSEYDALRAAAYMYRYLTEYHISMKMGLETSSGTGAVSKAEKYISEHFAEDISLADISEYAGVSEQYLCRVFRSRMKMSPFAYVNSVRISNAKKLLAEGVAVNRTAELSGFGDASYFCKVFREHEGVSPGKFLS
ncbi:MAG: AraC family transcriptional regulator [Oscillospiraceae bacterium]|nr:AraC family transcriptional regulator [Oscillospiraceae bacterium]